MEKMNFPAVCTIAVQDSMAKVFPMALPPTVRPATRADITRDTILGQVNSKLFRICAAMVAEAIHGAAFNKILHSALIQFTNTHALDKILQRAERSV